MNIASHQLWPQSVWMGLGLLAAVGGVLALGLGRFERLDVGEAIAVLGGCLVAGAAVGRLFWVVVEPAAPIDLAWTRPRVVFDLTRGGYSSFGALAGGAAVLGSWSRQTAGRRDGRVVDVVVVAALAGLGLARAGCLVAGCDFGRPADVAWAVRYPPGTDAFATHMQRGWVAADAAWSAPVHPFALYMVVGTAMIVVVSLAVLLAGRIRPGRVGLAAAGAYLAVRFVVEWTRDPGSVLAVVGSFNIHHLCSLVGLAVLAWWATNPSGSVSD